MRQFLIALQFLTILPIKISAQGACLPARQGSAYGGKSKISEEDFGKSLLYFPVVGALIGLVLTLALFLLEFLPTLVIGAFILILSIVITGGIHLDGFADTCDGFYGHRPKERILEIMRDSKIGAMGMIGIVSLLLLKFSLIVSIPQGILWKVLIVMVAFGRWSQALACYISEYARKEGKAKCFVEYASGDEFRIGTFFTLALFFVLLGLKGVVLFIFSLVPVLVFINYVSKKIGGMTGDTIGAASEISEIIILFFGLFYLGG
ncbi:MAG: adenosylcobinamide-GDP ribazoletransferase [Candidatus Omnitrophota bacterium]